MQTQPMLVPIEGAVARNHSGNQGEANSMRDHQETAGGGGGFERGRRKHHIYGGNNKKDKRG